MRPRAHAPTPINDASSLALLVVCFPSVGALGNAEIIGPRSYPSGFEGFRWGLRFGVEDGGKISIPGVCRESTRRVKTRQMGNFPTPTEEVDAHETRIEIVSSAQLARKM